MDLSKYFKATFFTLLSSFLVNISGQIHAQKSESLLHLYQTEQESWKEYMERYRDYVPNTTYDVLFYHLDVEIGINSPYIRGNVICRFEVRENSLQAIALNLHQSLSVDSITGNVSGFSHLNDSIYIDLDHAYLSGEIAQITIYYQGIPQLAGGYKGLRYEVHGQNEPIIATLSTPFLAHYWWPCKDGPGDKPDSVYIDVTIPDTTINGLPLMVSSNGVLENIITSGNRKTFQWRERYPIVTYYVMLAVSNYQTFQQLYQDSSGISFPIDYFVFNEHLSAAQAGVAQLPEAVGLFSRYFGAYPFHQEKYGMTQLGYYGAIENQTNTIQNNLSLSWFETSVHELAHMWFGDMITCQDWHHGWLNEGFATYSEALWAEYTGGFNAYKSNMMNNRYYDSGTLYLQNVSNPFQVFIPIIYLKGAYVLHMLRGVLGDSLFFDCISAYAHSAELRYDHATTEDFHNICENISQRDLDFFFDQWIYDQFYPSYQYSYIQEDSTVTVSIRQIQSQLGRRAVFEMPVQLLFEFSTGGDSLTTVWNDSMEQDFTFQFSEQVTNVQFDPDQWILRTVQLVNSIEPQDHPVISESFYLYQNYPNPFNNQTQISYYLNRTAEIEIALYSVIGEKVISLYRGIKSPGFHQLNFDAADLSGGIYFYRMSCGTGSQVRKLVLLK